MTASSEEAIVLFAHGARDARWALPLARLRRELERARPQASVQIAYLEFQGPSLPEVLAQLAAAGCRRIDIAPIFWSKGGHVVKDLAQLVRDFAAREANMTIRVLPVLSELAGMDEFVARAILAQGAPLP